LKGNIQLSARTIRGQQLFSVAKVLGVHCRLDPDGCHYIRRGLYPPGNMDKKAQGKDGEVDRQGDGEWVGKWHDYGWAMTQFLFADIGIKD
jgi:hypothetical protein